MIVNIFLCLLLFVRLLSITCRQFVLVLGKLQKKLFFLLAQPLSPPPSLELSGHIILGFFLGPKEVLFHSQAITLLSGLATKKRTFFAASLNLEAWFCVGAEI